MQYDILIRGQLQQYSYILTTKIWGMRPLLIPFLMSMTAFMSTILYWVSMIKQQKLNCYISFQISIRNHYIQIVFQCFFSQCKGNCLKDSFGIKWNITTLSIFAGLLYLSICLHFRFFEIIRNILQPLCRIATAAGKNNLQHNEDLFLDANISANLTR